MPCKSQLLIQVSFKIHPLQDLDLVLILQEKADTVYREFELVFSAMLLFVWVFYKEGAIAENILRGLHAQGWGKIKI